MAFEKEAIEVLSLATLIADGLILFLLYCIIMSRLKDINAKKIKRFFSGKAVLFSFVVSLVATLGSLFFSEIAGFEPCKLCWLQRIFMYPLPIIFAISHIFKERNVFMYARPLAIIGAGIAGFHYYIQRASLNIACGEGVSCTSDYMFKFGYITIPVMALSAFLLIIIFSLMHNEKKIEK